MLNNSIKYLENLFEGSFPDVGKGMKPLGKMEKQSEEYNPMLENEAVILEDYDQGIQDEIRKQGRVDSLIWAFRDVGYIYAQLNPLGNDYQEHYTNLPSIRSGIFEKLSAEDFDLGPEDMDKFFFGGAALDHQKKSLREILKVYSEIYCLSVGIEFLHIQNKVIRKWFIQKLEQERNRFELTASEKKIILDDLIKTEELELFLHKNYIGQKRFSIEGADSLIPCLHSLVNEAFDLKIREIVIGTTHRGRITILNRILQISLEEIFSLFEENYEPEMADGGGDVKYHIGYSMEHRHEDGGSVRITLPANPSHLESVGPVAEGLTRGLQDKTGGSGKNEIIPVIIHGEAAFSGQGVVAETFNMMGLEGYSTGGTIHIIINNQVGFTTSSRNEHSSGFATDIAKCLSIPILHVNGDDPESAVAVIKLAMEFRQAFHSDIVIDIVCYRKYGHNEGDDPSFTHPRMYEIIKNHLSVAGIYSGRCLKNNVMTASEIDNLRKSYSDELKKSFDEMHGRKSGSAQGGYSPHKIKYFDQELPSNQGVGISEETLASIAEGIHRIPEGFKIHEKLKRILETRLKLFNTEGTIDWAFAESIAIGGLLLEGHGVRLSGQDSERGTFSQRHLVWWEVDVDQPEYDIPLNRLKDGQAKLSVFDSPLSEYSILGFEFGYSQSCQDDLVMWEAQYGDFANGAQVIIDNYIIASEAKWNVRSGLVLLLPHGYEGQGPEHSNAHMERFLQLCAQENIQLCNVTTPAQYFCLLRRQVLLKVEKPLVIMTPKSLLRNPLAVSTKEELILGKFQYVIDDPLINVKECDKLIFCTGKIYYDLLVKRNELKKNIAIVRVEQLYPFPIKELEAILQKYQNVPVKVWVQEEPQNRGAWTFVKYQFDNLFNEKLQYTGRNPSASPATGSLAQSKAEQNKIISEALG